MDRLRVLLLLFLVASARCDDDEHSCDSGPHRSDDAEALANGANDVLAVRQDDGSLKSTPFHVQVGKFANWRTIGEIDVEKCAFFNS